MKVITTEKEYEKARQRLKEVFRAEEGTKEFEEAEKLARLVWFYEEKNHKI